MKLKPALTYNQQIDRLVHIHNLTITQRETAISILKRVNYYRLSGYGIGLKKPDHPEEYLDGKFVQGDTVALEMNENHIKFVRK